MGQLCIGVAKEAFDRFGSLPPSPRKQSEREQVLAFLLKHLGRRPWRHRILTMPSNNWAFEADLLAGRACELLCVEHDPWRISQGRPRVPFATGEQRHELVDGVLVHRGFAKAGETLWSVFYADLSTLLTLRRQEKGGGKRARRRWRNLFKMWSAAWVDYTGPISDRSLVSLSRVWSHLTKGLSTFPIVISYGVGRERGVVRDMIDRGAKRSDLIRDALNGSDQAPHLFQLVDVVRRRGAGHRSTRESVFVLAKEPQP